MQKKMLQYQMEKLWYGYLGRLNCSIQAQLEVNTMGTIFLESGRKDFAWSYLSDNGKQITHLALAVGGRTGFGKRSKAHGAVTIVKFLDNGDHDIESFSSKVTSQHLCFHCRI